MPHYEQLTRPALRLVQAEDDEPEQTYTINIPTLAVNGEEAHCLAQAVLERLADLPGLLSASTTVSFEEVVNRVMIR